MMPAEPRSLPTLWTVRTPSGARVSRREGDRFVPASTPWLVEQLSLLRLFVANDFRARYRAQALGVVWSLLQPLVMMGILSRVFKNAFADEPFYPMKVLVGLLVWQWMSASLNAATITFVVNADMVKRTVFPRALLPIAAVFSYGINAAVESLVLVALIPFFPGALHVSWALLAIPGLLACLILAIAGASLAASVLNVIYRDVAYLVSTGLLILYWLTPIIIPPNRLPDRMQGVLAWNPIGGVITGLRNILIHETWPSAIEWLRLGVPTLIIAVVGVLLFRAFEHDMLDHV